MVVLPTREDNPHGTLGLWVSGHCPPAPCLPSSLHPTPPSIAGLHSLVLNLEIEVPAEPVIEEGLLHIAGGCQLQRGQGISGWGVRTKSKDLDLPHKGHLNQGLRASL